MKVPDLKTVFVSGSVDICYFLQVVMISQEIKKKTFQPKHVGTEISRLRISATFLFPGRYQAPGEFPIRHSRSPFPASAGGVTGRSRSSWTPDGVTADPTSVG